ncbi:MAG: 4-(cytidine 5'-diphospho)-2-C-methyl-D-erythritol kinase [Oscillospiraceae bacterium]|nr:4-(cytidine 5'-diphospho)-2-C-methyl-D-erythritol kinase [Oscillospiraceae bacterium]
MTITAPAYAKINLSLDIVSKMDDGYHNMRMIMQSISLCDEVTVQCELGSGITVQTDLSYLPGDERNIAAKAAKAFFAHTGIDGYKTRIRIKKNIPVCAGLGGGSTDGACVLRVLDEMFETKLGHDLLKKLGGGIGSDIPFCIAGGTVLAEGKGDILTELSPIPHCYIVICKPPFAFSTPELFRRVKIDKIRARPDTDGIIESLKNGDLNDLSRRMYNVFEDILPKGERDIANIKYALLDQNALGAVMTGTGSAVFGIFENETSATNAYENLKLIYKECFLAETAGKIEIPN